MKTKHYRWLIVGVGVLVKTTALGFGRFSYSLLLPYMRLSLGFNYIQMGLLSGGILLGFLLVYQYLRYIWFQEGRFASLLCSALSMFWLSHSPILSFSFFHLAMGQRALTSP
jgi:hypothetical protein